MGCGHSEALYHLVPLVFENGLVEVGLWAAFVDTDSCAEMSLLAGGQVEEAGCAVEGRRVHFGT